MCLIAHKSRAFKSAIFKRRLSHLDKSDPENLKLPSVIENIQNNALNEVIKKLVDKYRKKDYILKNREELEEEKDWSDLEILLLAKFYKNQWSFIIKNENEFFPHFVFTYNIEPLRQEIDKIISHIYDKLDSEVSREELMNTFTYSGLEVTYLLHYFALTHHDYKEEE